MKKALFSKLLFLFLVLALDAWTKWLALNWVPPLENGVYPFGGFALFNLSGFSFSLNLVVNTGIACGLFPGFPALLLFLRLSVITGLFAFLFLKPAEAKLPLWLIAAGALGNVVDMICYGWVVDFLHFHFFGWSFPIFNLADTLISTGAVLLFFWPKQVRAVPSEL